MLKVIIPVAGFGTRLRPHTLTKPKVMLAVAGKPMIHYIVEQLIEEGVGDEIIFITGYLGEQVEKYLNDTFSKSADMFKFVEQSEPKGLGHAISCASEFFEENNHEAFIILGDTLFDVSLKDFVNSEYSVIGMKTVEDPRRFGVIEKNSDDFISRLVEKPASKDISPSNEAIVGLYYIKNSRLLFDSLKFIMENNITVKNEFQLTDALEKMLCEGELFRTYAIDGWLDCGKPETLLETNKYLLEKKKDKKDYSNYDAVIIQPVSIGENVTIENSIIGPYSSVSYNSVIKNSIVKNSIVYAGSYVNNAEIESEVLAENSKMEGNLNKLNLEDYKQ